MKVKIKFSAGPYVKLSLSYLLQFQHHEPTWPSKGKRPHTEIICVLFWLLLQLLKILHSLSKDFLWIIHFLYIYPFFLNYLFWRRTSSPFHWFYLLNVRERRGRQFCPYSFNTFTLPLVLPPILISYSAGLVVFKSGYSLNRFCMAQWLTWLRISVWPGLVFSTLFHQALTSLYFHLSPTYWNLSSPSVLTHSLHHWVLMCSFKIISTVPWEKRSHLFILSFGGDSIFNFMSKTKFLISPS